VRRPGAPLANEPSLPPPDSLEMISSQLGDSGDSGDSGERKRAIEALVHEIRITDGQVITPVACESPATH
jgi:site-specific DNA recombinase